jgi:two-component system cell cycle sensor histidine kinase/response regulator CckA
VSADVGDSVHEQEAVRRAEAQLHAVLEALPEPVVLHERGRILAANRAFVALLGFDSVDALVGHDALEFVYPEDREYVKGRLGSTLRNRRTPEHRIQDCHGRPIPVEVTGVPFPYEGRVVSLAAVHDLREQKRVDAELAAAERWASLGRVASAVGHELNNPLTYVLAALELVRRDLAALAADGADISTALSRVAVAREGAERARDIVRDLKALSIPMEDVIEAVDVHRVLDVAVSTAMHEIDHRARLVRDYGVIQPVSANQGRLIQVFVNLLINAAHAIPDGDAASNEIRIATRMIDASRVEIEVTDTGCGIPAGDEARLFEPFFTTKSGGTGIGLSIAHRIITSVGGTISGESRIPRGARFRVTLGVSEQSAATPEPVARQAAATRNARVLFADDEPLIRNLARELLAPYDVVTAASGRAAIRLLEADHFDAVVCDLQMPDLGGVDVYEWILAHKPELAERIVFTTGGVFTERARRFVADSERRLLEKPLDLERMRLVVDALVG